MKILNTGDVLDRHLKAFAEYDLDGVVADFHRMRCCFYRGEL